MLRDPPSFGAGAPGPRCALPATAAIPLPTEWSCPRFTGHSGGCGTRCEKLAGRAHFQPMTRHGILPASAIRVRPMERTDDEEVATDRRPDYGHLAGPSDRREVRYAVRQGLDEIRASGSRLVVRDRVPLFARGIPEVDHSVGHHFPQQSVQRSSGQLRVAAFDCGWTAQDCVRMVAASGSSMFSTS